MQELRARSIRVDRQQRKVFVVVSFPHVNDLGEETKQQIVLTVKQCIPKGYYGMVSFADDNFTELTFRRFLSDTLKKRFPVYAVNKEKTVVKMGDRKIDVVFHVSEVAKQAMETSEFLDALNDIVHDYTCYEVTFDIAVDDEEAELVDFTMQEKLVTLAVNRELMRPARVFRVENVVKTIGKLIDCAPMYISDIRKAMDSCVICGKISDKKLMSSKNNPNLWILRMTLSDDSGGKITCVMYARLDIADIETLRQTHSDKTEEQLQRIAERKRATNDKKLKKMMTLFDGQSVTVRGRIKFNDFSGELEMLGYDLCTCDILPISLQPTFVRKAPAEYSLVHPEEYREYRQMSFTEQVVTQTPVSDKTLVVLHVNATGYEMTKDKLYALCAVKIVNGRVSERFFTHINPEMSVDAKLLAACDCSVEKLVYCPTVTEVVPDLFKFIEGTTLVGMPQLSQVKQLLNYYAAPVGFNFDNNIDSQTQWLSMLYDRAHLDKKPNCADIAEVCKALKLPCASSVYCYETALAVARSMCLLAEKCE